MNPIEITYNGITLGGTSQYYINRLPGFYGADIRTSKDSLIDQDGSKIWNQKYGARSLAIEGDVMGDTVTEYLTNLRALVNAFSITDEAMPLVISTWEDTPTQKIIYARVITMPQPIEIAGESNVATFRIELEAESPFFLSTSDKNGSTSIAVTSGIPLSVPMGIPIGATTSGQITINNEGDIAAYPEFTIEDDLINPTISNLTTGEYFQIQDTLTFGDVVRVYIDSDGLHVLKNGTKIFDKFNGDIFTLIPGINVIKFSATGSSVSGLLTVDFTDHYLSL